LDYLSSKFSICVRKTIVLNPILREFGQRRTAREEKVVFNGKSSFASDASDRLPMLQRIDVISWCLRDILGRSSLKNPSDRVR
jgi:hypothetical protein